VCFSGKSRSRWVSVKFEVLIFGAAMSVLQGLSSLKIIHGKAESITR